MRSAREIREDAERSEKWGQELIRLRNGDLSTDNHVKKMIERLVSYVNSRSQVIENETKKLGTWCDGHVYYSTSRIIGDASDVTLQQIRLGKITFPAGAFSLKGSLDKPDGTPYLVLSSEKRDAELTTRRLEEIFKLITQLDQFLKRDQDVALVTGLERRTAEIAGLQAQLTATAEKLEALDRRFATRHHVHVPGSYFFGRGSFFQSQSQKTVRDLYEGLSAFQEKLQQVLQPHTCETVSYDKFAAHVKLR